MPAATRRQAQPLALLLLALGVGAACADELRTVNGEVLIGKVVEDQPGFVVFESETLGRVTIVRDRISRITATAAPAQPSGPSPEAMAAEAARAEGKTEAEQVAEKAADERKEALSEDAVGRFLARLNPLKDWNTKLGLGFVARRGEDNDNDLTLRFQSERVTKGGDEHKVEARYYYAEDVLTQGRKTATDELLTGSYRYRHALSPPLFFQALTGYYRDAIKELDHEVTQTFGVGGRVKGEWWSLTLTPAVGAQWRQIAGVDEGVQGVYGFYQEASLNITKTLKLSQTLEYLRAFEDSDDYSRRLGLDLTQKLGAAWSLGLRYDYNYDAVVGKNASELQQRYTLSVGLEF
jgi:hypothetical protein